MDQKILYFILVTAFTAGIVASNLPDWPESKEENIGDKNSKIELEKNEAIDLRHSLEGYNITEVEKRPVRCPNHYSNWQPLSEMECKFTERGAKNVTLITDAANYVDNPLGEQDYSTERFSTATSPWDLEFLPNGSRILTSRVGGIYIGDKNKSRRVAKLNVTVKGESGLLGLAVHPNFSENKFIYVYYTYRQAQGKLDAFKPAPVANKVSRYRLGENMTDEKVLLNKIPGNKYHSGGRLEFGPDGKLYVSTGDAGAGSIKPDKPQKIEFLGGKVLRINPDGSVPSDNPFNSSYIYSRGHRNPQGLAWNPLNGDLYTTEHGSWRQDEINHITPGGNYGWGDTECNNERKEKLASKMRTPVKCYKNWTMAPSGAAFVPKESSPWYGDLFVAGLRGSHVARISLKDDKVISEKVFYISKKLGTQHRLRDVEYRNNSLWIIGDSQGLVKITPEKTQSK